MGKISSVLKAFRDNTTKDFLRFLLMKQHQFFWWKRVYIKGWYWKQIITAQATSVGKGLRVGPDECLIWKFGDGQIKIGNDVTFYTPISITASSHLFPKATVEIGDRTRIGRNTAIRAAKSVKIGMDCLIADFVRIYDYNGHQLKPGSYDDIKTLRNRSGVPPEEVGEILIGNNVWIGDNAFIQRGVTIGDGSIVAANSVVIKNVPENVVVFGSPARVILWLDKKEQDNGNKDS